MFRPVRVTRASEEIVQQVKALIFGGRLGPGDPLPSEKDLAEEFGLSRVTVRDALRVLESQGLIEIKVGARGGAFVASPSTHPVSESLANMLRLKRATFQDLGEARLLVEPHVAFLAAQRATPEDMRAMEDAVTGARGARAAGDPYFIPSSVAFHIALAEAAKNPVLLFAVDSFRTLFHEALAALLPADDMAERAIADHQRILDAIKARDEDAARRLMHDHLSYFAARVDTGGPPRGSKDAPDRSAPGRSAAGVKAGMGVKAGGTSLLGPYRVLDLTDQHGWLCGRILGDLGADVIKIEPPGGDPGRFLGPFYHDEPDPRKSLGWLAYNANKRGVTLNLDTAEGQDRLRGLARSADFVIESSPPGWLEARGVDDRAVRALNPRLVWTSITPFGRTGPYAGYRGSDLVAMAMSGLMSLVGEPGRPPLRVSLPQAAMWTGMYAAAGTLIAHHARECFGYGQHVDVSMQASLLWALANAPAHWSLMRDHLHRAGSRIVGRSMTGARMRAIYRCRDGHINFIFYGGEAGKRSNEAMVRWMAELGEAPAWLTQIEWGAFNVASSTQEEIDTLEAPFVEFLGRRTKAEFSAEAVARGILGYPVSDVCDIRDDPQLAARGFWQEVDHPDLDATVTYPGPFARFSAAAWAIRRAAPGVGEHNAEILGAAPGAAPAPPEPGEAVGDLVSARGANGAKIVGALAGVKVVEFAVFAAGPMVGKHLGEHGATVIRVESRTRPDGFRVHYPPYKDNIPGLNRTGSFALFNDSKLGITLNLKAPEGAALAKRLVAWADILIENFVPGVMARNGLSYQAAREINPALIYLSSCNMGQTGPKASQRGFGSQLTSQSGFTYLTGYPGEDPMLLFGPYIDFIAVGFGLIAVLAALDFRRRTGRGQYIDLSQYETGLQFMAPALLDYETNGRVMTRAGNRSPDAAPHGAYPARGADRWCVVAAGADAEWEALCRAAGHPEWAEDPRFDTLSARKAHEDELDALIGAWTAQHTPEAVMEMLQGAGVPSGAVHRLGDLFTDPQLAHRRIWRDLPHAELGRFHYEAPPFTLSETPADLRPSPLLGEHNTHVYRDVLGLAEPDIARLIARGVIE